MRHQDDQPSIGIIHCKSKNEIIADYALRETTRPFGLLAYRLTTSLPTKLRGNLPTTKELFALESEKIAGTLTGVNYTEAKAELEAVLRRALKRSELADLFLSFG